MLSQILTQSLANLSKAAKPKSVRQRIKYYSRYPDKFRMKTRIRPPDLTDPDLKFPIHVPIRVRHQFHLKKQLIVPNSSKIHWNELTPNQILMAFQNIQYMSFKQIVQGLKWLSEVKGQQSKDWNKHEWVSKALDYINSNVHQIKKKDIMHFYFLMKKLGYKNQQFWKKMYRMIQDNYYDFYPSQFEYLYLTYYDKAEQVFTPETKVNLDKLMEGRLRQFSPNAILQIFDKFIRDKKIDNYWLENVFISLFKSIQYTYTPKNLAKIFRSMMILGHQNNERLYENLYSRIRKTQYKNIEDVQLLEQVLEEVKQIFVSHRVQPVLQFLAQKKQQIQQIKKNEVKKKTIQEMVKDDLKYFLERRRIKNQQKTNAQTSNFKGTQTPAS